MKDGIYEVGDVFQVRRGGSTWFVTSVNDGINVGRGRCVVRDRSNFYRHGDEVLVGLLVREENIYLGAAADFEQANAIAALLGHTS